MTPDFFAYNQYKDYVIYKKLAAVERVPAFRSILEELARHEYEDFEFWRKLSRKKEFFVSPVTVLFFTLIRRVFGLTFTAKFLEGREKKMIARYNAYLATVEDENLKRGIERAVEHERYHERKMVEQIEEDRVAFVSSIVLGLNDGLIELTGALAGFSFAFGSNDLVALAGVITGASASMSMAASGYMQARHEEGKDPKKAAFFTGVSYLIVVSILVSPFFIFATPAASLMAMACAVVAILVGISLYTSVVLDRMFTRTFGEMFVFSAGVALVAFFIGMLFKLFTGVSV